MSLTVLGLGLQYGELPRVRALGLLFNPWPYNATGSPYDQHTPEAAPDQAEAIPVPDIDEVRFPDDIARGATGGPAFNTVVVASGAGTEQRVAMWAQGRYRYNVGHALRNPDQARELVAFFVARQGRLRGFRFKDWTDYRATTPQAMTQIAAGTYQLVKRYASGGVERIRNITKPVAGTVRIWNADTEVLAGWTVDPTTGVVTFDSEPAYVPAATYEFDVPVRFDVDQMDMVLTSATTRDWTDIPLVEIRS